MPKVHDMGAGRVAFHCPGCHNSHQVGVAAPETVIWGYNGDPERPTFTPSVLTWNRHWVIDDPTAEPVYEPVPGMPNVRHDTRPGHFEERNRCHSFVTDGQIQFLTDSSHALAGQTVELPDWD